MEHAQRAQMIIRFCHFAQNVLILILMEHAQRVLWQKTSPNPSSVLILILMEHAQREPENFQKSESA